MPPTTLTEASLSAVTDEQRDQSLSHKSHIRSLWDSLSHHAKKHVGVGIVCAVAYFDPCVSIKISIVWPLCDLLPLQGKLEHRSAGWLSIRLQAPLRSPLVWPWRCTRPGNLVSHFPGGSSNIH